MERKMVSKTFSFEVAGEGSYDKRFELDKNIVLVHGVYLTSNNPKLLFFRGSQRTGDIP
jgi:hypothetical protein